MSSSPIFIALMGPTGSGKTNFINHLTGRQEDKAVYQHKSYTKGIREFTVRLSNNRLYVFVDMPGFDGNFRSDWETLRVIGGWLEKKYREEIKLTGIVYTHRITDSTASAIMCKNLDLFGRLCGDKAAERVRLVTTMWDKVKDKNLAKSRVSQLETNFWEPLLEAGARHEQFENSSDSAWKIVRGLMGEGEAVLLQEELVDVERKLIETTAGKGLYTQFEKALHEQKETIKQLQEKAKAQKDPELVKQFEADERRLDAELQKSWDNMGKLKIPLARRAALLLFSNTSAQTPDSAIEPNVFGEPHNDYVIFVVGLTGADKHWFTGQLVKNHDMNRHSYTENVKAWTCKFGNCSDNIIFVDTWSFHTEHEEFDAENLATDWSELRFTKKCHSGILFLHSLDSDPIHSDTPMSRHLKMFVKAFPFMVPSHIHVVPTRNLDSTLPGQTRSQRLLQLQTMIGALNDNREYGWHASIFPEVFEGQPEVAWSATLLLLKGITEAQAKKPFASPTPALKRLFPVASDAGSALKDLADLLFNEFRKEGRNSDFDAKITLGRTVLECTPLEHPQRHSALIDLADLLSERFKKGGRKEDLHELITLKRTASEHMSPNDPQGQTILLDLDDLLYEGFRLESSVVYLEEMISLRRGVLERTPPPNRCRPLLNLANSLHEKFQKQGLENDIDEALSLVRAALELCLPGHPDHSLSRHHLASYLKAKVRTRGARTHASGTSGSVPADIRQSIKKGFFETVEKFPLRLLHTQTGILCNRDAQLSHFERSPQYKQLLLSTSPPGSPKLEREIRDTVSECFGFAMLSHRWGSGEPLLRDVEDKNIYDLRGTDGLAKLQDFCILALEHNFQWAWSDTCCIDKDSSAELQEAIGSMFSWYHRSSLTIVYLSDVFDGGSLADSVWFKRGWTLQELLASHTILFYTHDWSPYMNCDAANHKTDPALLEELQKATGVAKQYLMNFYPGMEDARSRLHWASGRRTTRPEDVAYSLFGIFQVHLPVLYGEYGENALGRLLAEIISRSGDVSVLDWAGEPSSFNSCFPATLVPYQMVPDVQRTPSYPARRSDLDLKKAKILYNNLASLPRAGFFNSKLVLPSTTHPVRVAKLQGSSTSPSRYTYEIHASRLTPVKVTLSVNLEEGVGRYVLARPWHSKTLPTQSGSDDDAVWELLEQLQRPFNALLLKKLPQNEYRRIASDCTITACVQNLDNVLDSEVLTLEIV